MACAHDLRVASDEALPVSRLRAGDQAGDVARGGLAQRRGKRAPALAQAVLGALPPNRPLGPSQPYVPIRPFHIYKKSGKHYTSVMVRRTTIEIDEDLLKLAQEALGTSGLKATVDAALDEVVRTAARRDLIEILRTGRGIDRGPDILRASKEWRSPLDYASLTRARGMSRATRLSSRRGKKPSARTS